MLKFVRDCYQFYVSFILWVILIGCVVGGIALGGYTNLSANSNAAIIIGGLLGLLIGLIIIIAAGGFIATILNIDENLQKIADHYVKTSITNMNIDDNLQKITNHYLKISGVGMKKDKAPEEGGVAKKVAETDKGKLWE